MSSSMPGFAPMTCRPPPALCSECSAATRRTCHHTSDRCTRTSGCCMTGERGSGSLRAPGRSPAGRFGVRHQSDGGFVEARAVAASEGWRSVPTNTGASGRECAITGMNDGHWTPRMVGADRGQAAVDPMQASADDQPSCWIIDKRRHNIGKDQLVCTWLFGLTRLVVEHLT